ncbi:MAG: alkaline phosphatase family protein [Deltaproteobacteria bacterium]|nr:alkaline phosphatase family protein [Deltaproteobacteria bacterium]
MNREAKANNILVLGLDGMDPRLSKKFVEKGTMPNLKKLIERGAQREDLQMLGAMPTITPAQWTTLATGAYPETHGITDFWNQSKEDLSAMVYSLDSKMCQAEQIWNCFAEAGKKTLVWHWPGSAWPPTSDNPNLYVVDGAQPAAVNMSIANVDGEKMVLASKGVKNVGYKASTTEDTGSGCVIQDLPEEDNSAGSFLLERHKKKTVVNLFLSLEEGAAGLDNIPYDKVVSPIKEANGWTNAPEGALEFYIITSNGLVRRPALILKDVAGIYDTVAIYKSKKDAEPFVKMKEKEFAFAVIDDCNVDGKQVPCTRNYKPLEIAPDGSRVRLWMSTALDIANDVRWSPKSIYQDLIRHVGYVPSFCQMGGSNYENCSELLNPVWANYIKWQADALNYMIQEQGIEVIFSHIHFIDHQGHLYWNFALEKEGVGNDAGLYQALIEKVYKDADDYIGAFLHLLEEDWTIFITSDHGLQIHSEELPLIGDGMGCNVRVMQELGYTVLKKDENGNELREIDWEKTTAVATRSSYIWINLKGRNDTGIVEPEDQYAFEEKIIDDLYNYRHPKTGKRVIGIAIRNKEAQVLGLSGDETGDIVYMCKEGCCREHGESMSTYYGYFDTSISPIFVAAGKGLKKGFTTTRVIRQVDFAPTLAILGGVRIPAQCEGAPVYQILEQEL